MGAIVDGQAPADPALTVITTCYTRNLVRDCLNSICEHPPAEPFEIILVDDASTDGARWCPQSSPQVHFLRNDTNRNYSLLEQQAFDHARGQFVLLLDIDTIVRPLALDRMVFILARPPGG